MNNIELKKKYVIDATGRRLGRIASEAASLLMGKNRSDFSRNKAPDVLVEIVSASRMAFDAKKLKSKHYASHSGYPGSLKLRTLEFILKTRGASEVLRRAIYGMLPKNRLRSRMMKNLKIID